MTVRQLTSFMPQGASDLLIQSAISPPAQARRAWQAWTARRSLDEANWAEVRMLPSIAARALELGIAPEMLPRLDGIRRFVWAGAQKKLLAARPVLEQLARNGLSPLVLKGAAMIAAYPTMAGRRFLRDVDILVLPDRAMEALALIDRAGWRNPREPISEEAGLLYLARCHALGFHGPDGGEIDLHRFAMEPNCLPGDDDRLRARAVEAKFFDIPCQRPAGEDMLLHVLEHSFRRDPDQVLDWSLDAAQLIGAGSLDWDIVVDESLRRHVAVPVEARLRYLEESCGLVVPASVLAALEPAGRDPVFVNEYRARQFRGIKPWRTKRGALARGQRRRAELCLAENPPGEPDRALRAVPEVRQSAGGRRIDILLPEGELRKAHICIDAAADLADDWKCLVNCGVLQLRRFRGGESRWAKLRRRLLADVPIDLWLFAAQRTESLGLFVLRKPAGRKAEHGLAVECRATLKPGHVLAITLRLSRSVRLPEFPAP
jgi:hypothetical protein